MKPLFSFFATALLALSTQNAIAGMQVESGTLRVRGGSIKTDSLRVDGSLDGHGTVVSPSSAIPGTISPSGDVPEDTGTLVFVGPVDISGTFECTANGHEDLDLVSATETVSGSAKIRVAQAPSAIPLRQVVVSGAPDSDFSSFAIDPSQTDRFHSETTAPGDFAITNLDGDSDADGLPDYWEFDYYSDRILADPNLDDDGDRSINSYEFGAGTDPWDDQSVFAILRAETANGCKLLWNSVSGKLYSVQAASALEGAFDQILATNLAATAPVNSWTNSDPATFGPFYRIVVER